MVKGDPKRDYYADLNLNSNVDSEQIKKAYRELARLYHPDRNRGSEVDVVPKFQAIQAAHEILGDPESRQKYD
ncbi:heat shock protein DnaJ, partial [Eremomyces bilateralis CBS 781.70]